MHVGGYPALFPYQSSNLCYLCYGGVTVCTVNHPVTAHPGYLIDAPMKSMAAPGALFTRLLAHYRELSLTYEQIMALLDLNREHHERQVAI